MGFVTLRLSSSYKEQSKRRPFTIQKGTFYDVKGHLLQCKTCPFRMQKGVYQNANMNLYYITRGDI